MGPGHGRKGLRVKAECDSCGRPATRTVVVERTVGGGGYPEADVQVLRDACDECSGTVRFHGPMCRCGSRATKRVGYLRRECSACGQTYDYRLHGGTLVPMAHETAMALDESRRCS